MAHRRHWLVAGLVPLVFAGTSTAAFAAAEPGAATSDQQQAAPTLPTMPEIDRLNLGTDLSDRMTLPVQIGGLGPYAFLIDTGSQRSIVATELAQRLSLPELPPVEIISMGGRETVAAVHLNEIRYGNQVSRDMPALSIAHDSLGSAGLIGLDGLKGKRVTLDFRARKLELTRSQPSRRDETGIIVRAKSKLGQLILVNSKIDGSRVNVVLDTGAELSVGNMALFNSLKQKKLVIPPQPSTITSVTGEVIPVLFTVVRRIDIESVTLENVPMVFLDAAPFAELDLQDRPAMLLGMRMLRMFDRVAIDFGTREVNFQLPRSDSGERKTRDMLAAL